MPAAWMGFAPRVAHSPRACVRICAWCPDKAEADRLAYIWGYDVTHGQCPACVQRVMAKLLGEPVPD